MARPKKEFKEADLTALNLSVCEPRIHRWHRRSEIGQKFKNKLNDYVTNLWYQRKVGTLELSELQSEQIHQTFLKLPRHEICHIRGFWEGDRVFFRMSESQDFYLPYLRHTAPQYDEIDCLFHCQPTHSDVSDIPAREDVFRFLKFDIKVLITIGEKYIGIFQKDKDTEDLSRRLRKWDSKNSRTKISRFRKKHPRWRDEKGKIIPADSPEQTFRRYCYAALREVGLKWPGKISKRKKEWPQAFASLGISVTVIDLESNSLLYP